jgi:hypothetical protein
VHGIGQTPDLFDFNSTTSPSFNSTGGWRLNPTPAGVPVAMMSPGSSVINWLRQETIGLTPKIMFPVSPF